MYRKLLYLAAAVVISVGFASAPAAFAQGNTSQMPRQNAPGPMQGQRMMGGHGGDGAMTGGVHGMGGMNGMMGAMDAMSRMANLQHHDGARHEPPGRSGSAVARLIGPAAAAERKQAWQACVRSFLDVRYRAVRAPH